MSVVVKICGNRSLADLRAAAEAGADLVGIVFAPSRRQVKPEAAREMVAALREEIKDPPQVVGVFADWPPDEVNRVADQAGLDIVQLHGNEDLNYCAWIERPVIKTLRLRPGVALKAALDLLAQARVSLEHRGALMLVEPFVENALGGTGTRLDLLLAKGLAARYSFLLAGGLTPSNVAEAVRVANPWGVDVSSGVETSGAKEYDKVGRFVHEARRAAQIAAR